MSIIRSVLVRKDHFLRRARGKAFAFRIRLWGGYAGRGIMVEKGVRLRHRPNRNWHFEGGSYLGYGVILDIWPGAELRVGHGTKIMHYVVIGALESVTIGRNSQIAEHSTIRDADHPVDTEGLISEAPMISKPVSIGNNTWVARGCAIISGAKLGDGVVVAANSVVRSTLPNHVLAAGAPAQVKRERRLTRIN